jgi:hypothetical protein
MNDLTPNHSLFEQRRSVAYLDGLYPEGHLRQAKVNALRELQSPALRYGDGSQSASGEELSTLLPSILDKAFKGEL